jgi:hypothetical protein
MNEVNDLADDEKKARREVDGNSQWRIVLLEGRL